ncbi:MAG TPA: hypothetical protein VGO11_08190 [Chthoniobacteraceae bacterium]|jgi:hypothetical protein|nr:hypothetical protein [Chthoniobacteraceae bacterium]
MKATTPPQTRSAAPDEFRVIVGKRPWRVWKGFSSFLLFEFGRAHRNEDGSRSGAYTLWIYLADWTVWKEAQELAHSESPDEVIHRAAEAFVGKCVLNVTMACFIEQRRTQTRATFRFEGGYILRAAMYDRGADDDAIFYLYTPKGILSYRRDGLMESEPLAA